MPTYTLATYRAVKDPIRNEGPWALTGNPHTPFYSNRKGNEIRLIGLHITAGINDYVGEDRSAEGTVNYGRSAESASWHGIVDSDSIIPCLPDSYTAWVQGASGYSFNSPGLGLEIGKGDTDWNSAPKAWVEATLRNAAAWCAPRVIEYDIPIRLMTNRDEIQRLINAGKPAGFAYHHDLSPSTRSDPGLHRQQETFPWSQFAAYLAEEVAIRKGAAPTPIEEPDMQWNDIIPGLKDADGKPVTLAQAVARAQYCYTAITEGGGTDMRIDFLMASQAKVVEGLRTLAASTSDAAMRSRVEKLLAAATVDVNVNLGKGK